MDEVRVYMRHIRAANLCAGGTRDWFQKYGLDWSSFIKDGVDVTALEQTGDPLGAKVAAVARQEFANGQ